MEREESNEHAFTDSFTFITFIMHTRRCQLKLSEYQRNKKYFSRHLENQTILWHTLSRKGGRR